MTPYLRASGADPFKPAASGPLVIDAEALAGLHTGDVSVPIWLALPAPDALDPATLAAVPVIAGVVLEATSSRADVEHLAARLAVAEALGEWPDGALRVVARIATAKGALGLAGLGAGHPRLAGIAWDADALAADLGAASPRGPGGALIAPLATVRSAVVVAAAAAGVTAIDSAFAGDDDAFIRDAEAARTDGFNAKFALTAEQAAALGAL
ncbi:hypothetical protein ACFSCV_02915 [Methylopila henanensis]|uniref:HpcH/HpaI aldolase/citrate lyase domain-containing protein n=1 Tax=Methylopila henanensis TaxID=873516 RepID=A0ABW4K4F0_9HYPH